MTLEGTQRIYAEKAINDVLFEASFGNLDRNSVSITVIDTRNPPSTSYSYSSSPPKNIPFNDNELFGVRMNARVADKGKQNNFPCRDDDKKHEATGTAEEFVTVTAVTPKHPTMKIFSIPPTCIPTMFESDEPQHGDICKPELMTQSKSRSDVQAISSAGIVEAAVAVGALTSHGTAYGDANDVYPEVFEDPVSVPVDIHGEYEITEIIENDSTYQQPIMLLLPNPHISGENNYIVVTPEYQPTENQEMDSSSNLDQSLRTYFQNFTSIAAKLHRLAQPTAGETCMRGMQRNNQCQEPGNIIDSLSVLISPP